MGTKDMIREQPLIDQLEKAWALEVESRIDAYDRGEMGSLSMAESKQCLGVGQSFLQ